MSTQNNPFVLPGLGQTGDSSGNPMMASLEMMQQAWAGLTGPSGLVQAMSVPMNLEDLDRRIVELRTVENWLKLNQSMLSSTIQGMEVQRATLATLKSFAGAMPTGDAPSPLDVARGLKPEPVTANDAPQAASDSGAAAAQSVSQAWWNLMQQQFGQLASAAAGSMTEAAATSTAPHVAQSPAASPAKKSPVRRAAPRRAPIKTAKTVKTAKKPV